MDKQQTQYQRIPKWKWKMLTNCSNFHSWNVQTFGFVYHDTNGLNNGPVWKNLSFFFKGICTVILWQDYYGKAIWEEPIETWLGENSKLGMSLCTSWKRTILSVYVDDIKIGLKETKSWSDVETTQQSRFGRTNIFPGSCILGLHSKTMWNKQKYCAQLHNHVWIANFRGESRVISIPSICSYFFMVLWHGWSCKEVCGTILWVGKQDDSATLQSMYSMHRWPSLQRRRKEICWRIVTSMLSNCSEISNILQELDDLIFYGQWISLQVPSQNGPRLVTNAWIDWFRIFIILVNTDNVVMWVILPNNADWDCFKTLTSREILKIRNPLLEEHCAFLEVIHLFQ